MPRKKILISQLSTLPPKGTNKDKIKEKTEQIAEKISDLTRIMSANKKHSLLVVLQGMDSSGKDGVSREVFSRVSPTMVSAYSFKKPTDQEFAHDFLWRIHKHAPAKGEIKIFVRSHYEDILIQRVHNWINAKTVTNRINSINAFENLLQDDNGTIVIKFFLNISKKKQLEKLTERIENPDKNFKHNDGDWEERKHWRKYMNAYQDAMNRSSIPWIPVPADEKWYRNYYVANEVFKKLLSLKESYPAFKEAPKVDYKNAK